MRLIPDRILAAITIWQESRGEPFDGKIAVAEVIRNRTRAGYMSDGSVAGTCLRAFQFSGWNPTDPNRVPSVKIDDSDPIVGQCLEAWDRAEAGSDLVGGAVHYLNVDLVLRTLGRLPEWAAEPSDPRKVKSLKVTAVVGRHTFLTA